jgi:hypothetical protein
MVVRLQTAEGEIKKYETKKGIYNTVGEATYIEKYVTKCGQEWKPGEKNQDCDHLDCAIYLVKQQRDGGPKGFMLFIALAAGIMILWGHGQDLGFWLMISGAMTLLAFGSLIEGLRAGRRVEELTEFKDRSTIKGITAWSYFLEDQIILRLQMDNGEIKEYQTMYGVGCTSHEDNFFNYKKWADKCGIKRPKEPCQECAPLECAIYKAEKRWRRYEMIKRFFAAIVAISFVILVIAEHRLMPLIIFVLSVCAAIVLFGLGQNCKEYLDELNEFKNNGTINGIQARQSFNNS